MGICGGKQSKRPSNAELAVTHNLPPAEVDHYEKLFKQFDLDGNGKITAKELGIAMERIGIKTTPDVLKEIVKANDKDGSGKIEFPEFLTIVARQKTSQGELEKKAAEAFAAFDKDNDGTITMDELRETLKMLQMTVQEDELQRMMKDVDKDGDGKINKEEFVGMYKQIAAK